MCSVGIAVPEDVAVGVVAAAAVDRTATVAASGGCGDCSRDEDC